MDSPDLGGIHFTGSTGVFQGMWEHVGTNIKKYKSYPRLVGETGGKDFIMVHASADPQEVAVAMVRGAFEYQGQKCSAASRVYVPKSLWPEVRDRAVAMMREITMGDTRDFRNFMGAVIDKQRLQQDQRLHGACQAPRQDRAGRRRQRSRRLLHRAHARRHRRSRLPSDVRRDFRAGADSASLSR